MSSELQSLTGAFESCWRVLLDTDGTEEGERTLTINTTGWDGMVAAVEKAGFTTDNILHYTHC